MVRVKLLIVTVLVSLAMPVYVDAQLSMTRDSLKADIKMKVRQSALFPDSSIHRSINMALLELSTDFPVIQKIDTLIFTVDSFGVTLSVDFDRVAVAFRRFGNSWIPMVGISPDSIPITITTLGQVVADPQNPLEPRHYWTQDNIFYPSPKSARVKDTFHVWYYAVSSALYADNIPAGFRLKYRDELINLAVSIGYARLRMYSDAAFYRKLAGFGATPATRKQVGEK